MQSGKEIIVYPKEERPSIVVTKDRQKRFLDTLKQVGLKRQNRERYANDNLAILVKETPKGLKVSIASCLASSYGKSVILGFAATNGNRFAGHHSDNQREIQKGWRRKCDYWLVPKKKR